jgi:tetratricopeptide (TPR) repeat protein
MEQIEKRTEAGDMSGVAQVYLSIGLLGTLQFERAVEDGSLYLKPNALYFAGRADDAVALARQQASDGYPEAYFMLLNRLGRSAELVDFLEERWPNLSAFAEENRGGIDGYSLMAQVAFAYLTLGQQERFDEAIGFVERHSENLRGQGINNIVFDYNQAVAAALQGDHDQALDYLQQSIDGGMTAFGSLAKVEPALAVLAEDDRFVEIETTMRQTINRDRAVVGLPPVDENYQVMAATAPDAASLP